MTSPTKRTGPAPPDAHPHEHERHLKDRMRVSLHSLFHHNNAPTCHAQHAQHELRGGVSVPASPAYLCCPALAHLQCPRLTCATVLLCVSAPAMPPPHSKLHEGAPVPQPYLRNRRALLQAEVGCSLSREAPHHFPQCNHLGGPFGGQVLPARRPRMQECAVECAMRSRCARASCSCCCCCVYVCACVCICTCV